MATYNSYIVDSSKRWRKTQIECARKAIAAGNIKQARKNLRTAVVLSFRRRESIALLREGREFARSTTTKEDAERLDKHLMAHAKLIGELVTSR